MKIFLLFISLVFLVGCASLNPYSRQLNRLEILYQQGQISASDYVGYKMLLTQQEFLWNQKIGTTLGELSQPPETKTIQYQPLKLNTEGLPSSLNKKKYTGTIEPSLNDQYKITIEEQP